MPYCLSGAQLISKLTNVSEVNISRSAAADLMGRDKPLRQLSGEHRIWTNKQDMCSRVNCDLLNLIGPFSGSSSFGAEFQRIMNRNSNVLCLADGKYYKIRILAQSQRDQDRGAGEHANNIPLNCESYS
jgi:hypothetical protein